MGHEEEGTLAKRYFLLRRLHSLTGILPIGVFLIFHLTTNSSVLWGAANTRAHADDLPGRGIATFQHEVSFINNLPGLLIMEITLWAAIAFHAILGIWYATTGKSNTARYPHMDNRRYALQRLTGYIALLFILYHIATLRWGWSFLVPGGVTWGHEHAASTLALALRGSADSITVAGLAVSLFYFVGVTSAVFHFANGLWTAAITWGLTISTAAQRRWGVVCAGLGILLMAMAWGSVVGFLFTDPEKAREIESAMHPEEDSTEHTARATTDGAP